MNSYFTDSYMIFEGHRYDALNSCAEIITNKSNRIYLIMVNEFVPETLSKYYRSLNPGITPIVFPIHTLGIDSAEAYENDPRVFRADISQTFEELMEYKSIINNLELEVKHTLIPLGIYNPHNIILCEYIRNLILTRNYTIYCEQPQIGLHPEYFQESLKRIPDFDRHNVTHNTEVSNAVVPTSIYFEKKSTQEVL